jgi:ABC-type transport system substrate-binding protein
VARALSPQLRLPRTWYDQDQKPIPALARRWETSADGKTWTSLSTFTSAEIQDRGDTQYSTPAFDELCAAQWEATDRAGPDDRTARKALTDRMQFVRYRGSPYVILW